MASANDYKELSKSIMDFECYRRYTVHNSLKDSGIYFGQPPILDYLALNGTSTQNEIAKAMYVSPASVAVSVKRMQKSGLIEKINDENDLRRNRISITDRGRKQIEVIHRRFDEIDRLMYDGFSDDEIAEFKSYVDRLVANLAANAPDRETMYKTMKAEFMSGHGGNKE